MMPQNKSDLDPWKEPAVATLLQYFQKIGAQVPFWTQAQGSNLSVKIKDSLLIKPSGYRLRDVHSTKDLAKISLDELRAALNPQAAVGSDRPTEIQYAALLGQAENSDGKSCRASMETGFHALLAGKFVFHFHSLAAIIMAEMYFQKVPSFLKWMEEQKEVTFLPFVVPGLQLSYELAQCNGGRSSGTILMRNHGVVIHFDYERTFDNWIELEEEFYRRFLQIDFVEIKRDATQSLEKIINKFNCKMPLKVLFPDLAVFKDQILHHLAGEDKSVDPEMEPLTAAMGVSHPDLTELWLATMILYQLYPSLPEIDQEVGLHISQLPTEQFRKGKT